MTDLELIAACRKLIGMYGTLRYCNGGACSCMGCVNQVLTKAQYNHALTLPEVQEMMENPSMCRLDFINDYSLEARLKRYKESKHGKTPKIESHTLE